MSAVYITVALPAAPPVLIGRALLINPPGPRVAATLREADAWCRRNADSFRDGLEPGETYFMAWILDGDHEVVRTLEFPREQGAAPIVLNRKTLQALKAAMTKTTTAGEETES